MMSVYRGPNAPAQARTVRAHATYCAVLVCIVAPAVLGAQTVLQCCEVPHDALVRSIRGDTVVLNEGGEFGASYRDVRYVQPFENGFHIFKIGEYEGGHYMLVDPKLEQQIYLDAVPVTSPRGLFLATILFPDAWVDFDFNDWRIVALVRDLVTASAYEIGLPDRTLFLADSLLGTTEAPTPDSRLGTPPSRR